jgi:hypothetical protein
VSLDGYVFLDVDSSHVPLVQNLGLLESNQIKSVFSARGTSVSLTTEGTDHSPTKG